MDTLFGIPMGGLATGVVILLAAALAVVMTLAVRNRVFARLAFWSAVRRQSRTALIVLGLMLATTIITSALVTGDTMSTTMRSSVIQSLGEADEVRPSKAPTPKGSRPWWSSVAPPTSSTSTSPR